MAENYSKTRCRRVGHVGFAGSGILNLPGLGVAHAADKPAILDASRSRNPERPNRSLRLSGHRAA
jgi:hypothetical protein